jgi:hypothetical protein
MNYSGAIAATGASGLSQYLLVAFERGAKVSHITFCITYYFFHKTIDGIIDSIIVSAKKAR